MRSLLFCPLPLNCLHFSQNNRPEITPDALLNIKFFYRKLRTPNVDQLREANEKISNSSQLYLVFEFYFMK